MIDFVVRSTIGQWGSSLLDFYQEYSLFINGIILLLALAMWINKRRSND